MTQTCSDHKDQDEPFYLFRGRVSLYFHRRFTALRVALVDDTPCQPGILARIKERLFLPWMLEYMYR